MKKYFLLSLCLLMISPIFAARLLPQDGQLAILSGAQGLQVRLAPPKVSALKIITLGLWDDSRLVRAAQSVLVRDTFNRFVTYNQLPRFAGQPVVVRFSPDGQIKEIWILTEAEVEQLQ